MKNKLLSLLASIIPFNSHRWTAPKHPTEFEAEAIFYPKYLIGVMMSNGQRYDADALTMAHDSLPIGSVAYVSYRSRSGAIRNCHATVSDRLPQARGKIVLSWAAFRQLESPHAESIPVRVTVLS